MNLMGAPQFIAGVAWLGLRIEDLKEKEAERLNGKKKKSQVRWCNYLSLYNCIFPVQGSFYGDRSQFATIGNSYYPNYCFGRGEYA